MSDAFKKLAEVLAGNDVIIEAVNDKAGDIVSLKLYIDGHAVEIVPETGERGARLEVRRAD